MKEKEIWKSVGIFKGVDLTGYYEASNLGRVKRLARTDCAGRLIPEKILTRVPNKYGDVFISVNFNGKIICGMASQYVMNAFHPDHDKSKNRIRHIDGNKLNNRLDNLEWSTQKEIFAQGTFTEKQAQALREKVSPVVQLDLNGNFVAEYRLRDDIRDAGFVSEAVINTINKKKYFYKGYIWMHKPNYENSTIKDIKEISNKVKEHKGNIGKGNRKSILQFDEGGNLVAEYNSVTQASKAIGCSKQAISICLTDPQHHISCKGYIWRYKK